MYCGRCDRSFACADEHQNMTTLQEYARRVVDLELKNLRLNDEIQSLIAQRTKLRNEVREYKTRCDSVLVDEKKE